MQSSTPLCLARSQGHLGFAGCGFTHPVLGGVDRSPHSNSQPLMKSGPPDRHSVALGAGCPIRNTGRCGGQWQAAGSVWAGCWSDLIVSDRASGWLQGRPFRGRRLSCNRWHHKQLLWGPAANACSKGASSYFCTLPLHPYPLSLGRGRSKDGVLLFVLFL